MSSNQVVDEQFLRYAKLAKQYLRPPGSITSDTQTTFGSFTKKDILDLLERPANSERQLRKASIMLYNISSHYRRLISYFAKMPTFDFYLTPLGVDPQAKINEKSFKSCFKKAVDQVERMNLKHELQKVSTTIWREDVFYGYEYEQKDSYFIQKLNADYCRLSAIEDGVFTFEFDFSFFNSRLHLLPYYAPEFQRKYELYKSDRKGKRWQELDTKKEVCFKLNEDLEYIFPPFAGTFPDIYDIADYKQLMKARTEIDNYKLVYLKIPFENGRFKLPERLANNYYEQMGQQMPPGVGLGMTPMDIDQVSFEQSGNTRDTDTVARSEAAFWSGSGASSAILGKDDITSSSAIMLSIETDAEIVYSLLRQIERWVNRKLKQLSGTYHFKLTFLNSTVFNKQNAQEQYLKACQYSFPLKYAAAAAYGITPSDFSGLLVLENETMKLHEEMIPVSSSHTQSSDSSPGRPAQDTVDESGEKNRANDSNDKR